MNFPKRMRFSIPSIIMGMRIMLSIHMVLCCITTAYAHSAYMVENMTAVALFRCLRVASR